MLKGFVTFYYYSTIRFAGGDFKSFLV
jgi:hypothetical protein